MAAIVRNDDDEKFHNNRRVQGKKVLITRNVPEKGLVLLKSAGVTIDEWQSDDPIPREVFEQKVAGVNGIFCLLTDKIDKTLLEKAGPQLKVVGTMSVGFDHIDLNECASRGISVGYTPNVLTHATAELTVALLLATSRRLLEGADAVKSGKWGTWKPMWLCGPSLENSTVGIYGFGRIAQKVAQFLSGFSVRRFLYAERKDVDAAIQATRVTFDQLLQESDFIICCCALNKETAGIFDSKAFNLMKPSAVFINTSRGPVVNHSDLCDALETGKLAAAGLDVTVPEPLPTDHRLLKLPNCVVLPHIGSATNETRSAMAELTSKNILAAFRDESLPAQV